MRIEKQGRERGRELPQKSSKVFPKKEGGNKKKLPKKERKKERTS